MKLARFKVLTLAECPAVLIEFGHLSNPQEELALGDAGYRLTLVKAVANGVEAFAARAEIVNDDAATSDDAKLAE